SIVNGASGRSAAVAAEAAVFIAAHFARSRPLERASSKQRLACSAQSYVPAKGRALSCFFNFLSMGERAQ
ncbi:MAG: hypothetical protein K0S65_5126, partial [Labilithrix sp.]|nr:hypothetical protein [Labilithrix sp.]